MARRPQPNSTSNAVTLADVADAAGVSLATASRALDLSSSRRVRDDLAKRVRWAAAALDYSPNAQAKAMVRGETNIVGLVVHDIADPYFSSIAAGVTRRAEEHGLMVTLVNTQRSVEREIEYVATLRNQRARALILAGSRVASPPALAQLGSELELFRATGGRVAMVSQKRLPIDTVQVENRAGARALAHALHELGYRDFAVLAGPGELLTARDRLGGFRDALARLGCPVPSHHVIHGAFTRDGGYDAMEQLIDRGPQASCVFAVNDIMAVGALAALRRHGLEPPAGVAIAGFDDIALLNDITPGLTTVRVPLEELGVRALDLVVGEPAAKPRLVRVGCDVVIRHSTPRRTQSP